jgi:hypothetical protein
LTDTEDSIGFKSKQPGTDVPPAVPVALIEDRGGYGDNLGRDAGRDSGRDFGRGGGRGGDRGGRGAGRGAGRGKDNWICPNLESVPHTTNLLSVTYAQMLEFQLPQPFDS